MNISEKLITIADNVPKVAEAVNAKKGKNLLSAFSKFPSAIAYNAEPIHMVAGQKYTFSFKGQYTAWRLMFRGTQMDGSDFPIGSAAETQDDFISCTQRTATSSDATYGTRIQMQNNATGNSIVLTCTNDFILTAIQLWVTGTEVTPYYEVQLELGSVATDYEPYKDPALYKEALAKCQEIKTALVALKEELT